MAVLWEEEWHACLHAAGPALGKVLGKYRAAAGKPEPELAAAPLPVRNQAKLAQRWAPVAVQGSPGVVGGTEGTLSHSF